MLNVIFSNSIIGEIKIQYGTNPPEFHSKKLLNELCKADSAEKFK